MVTIESLLPLGVGFTIVLLAMWYVMFKGLRPLQVLSNELASRKSEELQPLQSPPVYGELKPLVTELNASFARIKNMRQRERDFLADAAHELRTPLALITAQIDLLINSQVPTEREDSANKLRKGIERASRLVGQLLMLARLEAQTHNALQATDLADVVRDTLATFSKTARERGIEMSYKGPDSLVPPMPGHAFATVLENLMGNAIRYGDEGGVIEVTLQESKDHEVSLTVVDDGPGIALEQREKIFERFHRGMQTQQSGSGLGLAIVRAAAKQFGASVELSEGLYERGVCFSLRWPLQRQYEKK